MVDVEDSKSSARKGVRVRVSGGPPLSCLLKTKQNTKYLFNNIEECISMANALLGTEETYILRFPRDGFPNAGHEEIKLSHVISTVRYIYKELGLTSDVFSRRLPNKIFNFLQSSLVGI